MRTGALLALIFVAAALAAAQSPDTTRPRISVRVITPPPPAADTVLFHQVAPGTPLLVELTAKSPRLRFDSLFINSRTDQKDWPYAGLPLDTSFEAVFQPVYPELAIPHHEPELFAVKRMVLDAAHIGYLLRVPGMYEPSRLDLWIYDARATRFAAPIEVAESWGDAGCGFDLEALLIHSPAGVLQLVTHRNTGCVDIETGRTKSNVDSIWVRTWAAGGFTLPRASSDSMLLSLLKARHRRLQSEVR